MRRDIFKTLFSRMLATYLTVILCLLLLMGITVSGMFRNQYKQETENSLHAQTQYINTVLEDIYVYRDRQEFAVRELKSIARQYGGLIQVVDQLGDSVVFYDQDTADAKWGGIAEFTQKNLDENGNYLSTSLCGIDIWPEADTAMFRITGIRRRPWSFRRLEGGALTEQGVLIYDLLSNYSDMPTLTLVRAFYNKGDMQGAILMHLDMSGVNESIDRVYLDVLLIGLMAIAAAVLAVYYLTTRITKPIADMSGIVQRYSKGAFELRLDASGSDEVSQLARNFNAMADAVNDLEETRRSFVANVSHELRSPLTSISGFLEAIQDGTIPEERHGEYLDVVIQETKRMTNMVNNLLNLARMESGQTEMMESVFDMNEAARRMILTFEARINVKLLDVELDLVEPHCYVEADADQIGQVLRNLIDNAIKFSHPGGRLVIRTAFADRRTAEISVQDYGAGIPEEDLRHIFDRFYKAEKAHTPSAQSGTGLGLSIARVIIDQHGQDISVKSELGRGTTFRFTLRRVQETRRRPEMKTDERNNKPTEGKGETS